MMLRWWDPLPAGYSVKLGDGWPAERLMLRAALHRRDQAKQELTDAQLALGAEVHASRIRLGLNLRQAAAVLGISHPMVWQIEKGICFASADLVETLIRLEAEATAAKSTADQPCCGAAAG
jgi:DNA-binding XRE family transcriptional regulator